MWADIVVSSTNLTKSPEGYVNVYVGNEQKEFRLNGEYTIKKGGTELIIVALQDETGNVKFGILTKGVKEGSTGVKIDIWQFNPLNEPDGTISFGGETYKYWMK